MYPQHSPGNWQSSVASAVGGPQYVVHDSRGGPVALVYNFQAEHAKANADLVAAAPDLLEACRQIIWKLSHNWDDGKPARIDRLDATVRMAADAIKKALGDY